MLYAKTIVQRKGGYPMTRLIHYAILYQLVTSSLLYCASTASCSTAETTIEVYNPFRKKEIKEIISLTSERYDALVSVNGQCPQESLASLMPVFSLIIDDYEHAKTKKNRTSIQKLALPACDLFLRIASDHTCCLSQASNINLQKCFALINRPIILQDICNTGKQGLTFAEHSYLIEDWHQKKPAYYHDFLHAADQLKINADALLKKRGTTLLTSDHPGEPSRKSKIRRFLSLNRKKSSKYQGFFSPHALSAPTGTEQNHEKEYISDLYFSALAYYADCYEKQHSLYKSYIKQQVKAILNTLQTLHKPMQLFAGTTLFEPGYKDIIIQTKRIADAPILRDRLLQDVEHIEQKARHLLANKPSNKVITTVGKKLAIGLLMLSSMQHDYNNSETQNIISHAYAQSLHALLKELPEDCAQEPLLQTALSAWNKIRAKTFNMHALYDEISQKSKDITALCFQAKRSCYQSFNKEIEADLLLKIQAITHVEKWYARDPIALYLITESIKALHYPLKLIAKQSVHATYERITPTQATLDYIEAFIASCQGKQDHAIINAQAGIMRVLCDMYEKQLLPNIRLERALQSLQKTIEMLDSLKKTESNPKLQNDIKRSKAILSKSAYEYQIKRILKEGEYCMRQEKNNAKRLFLQAARIVLSDNLENSSGIILDLSILDRLIPNLCLLHTAGVPFSSEELSTLETFARFMQMDLPNAIQVDIAQMRLSTEIAAEANELRMFLHAMQKHS